VRGCREARVTLEAREKRQAMERWSFSADLGRHVFNELVGNMISILVC
jgi:hypothetical protein